MRVLVNFWLTVVMLCCCVCNWSAIQTMVAKLPFSLPVHLPCLSIVINVAPPNCGAFLPCDRELLIQFDHLFHVSTVDLLFVAISVFIRNHTGIVISLWFAVRDDGTSVIGVHHIVRTGTGAQGKVSIQAEIIAAVFFIIFSLKRLINLNSID